MKASRSPFGLATTDKFTDAGSVYRMSPGKYNRLSLSLSVVS